jgi:hypothetical protein
LYYFKALNIGVPQVRDAFGDGQGFDTFTYLVDIDAFLVAKFSDPGSAVRSQGDQAFRLQDPQCLADGQPAESETGSELFLHDSRTGRKRSADDLGSQVRGYSVAGHRRHAAGRPSRGVISHACHPSRSGGSVM